MAMATASPMARVSVATAMITSMRKEGEDDLPEEALAAVRARRRGRADVGDVPK
jgi:hypothetical protein